MFEAVSQLGRCFNLELDICSIMRQQAFLFQLLLPVQQPDLALDSLCIQHLTACCAAGLPVSAEPSLWKTISIVLEDMAATFAMAQAFTDRTSCDYKIECALIRGRTSIGDEDSSRWQSTGGVRGLYCFDSMSFGFQFTIIN